MPILSGTPVVSGPESLPLVVALPLMAALAGVLWQRWPRFAWGWAVAVSGATTAGCLWLASLALATQGAPLSSPLGNWEPPWGIEYRLDLLNAPLLVLVAVMAMLAILFGRPLIEQTLSPARQPLYYIALLLCMTGLLGMLLTGDAFNVFVFLEIASLSSYALIALGKTRRSLSAAFSYLIIGTVGATFYVIGIGMLYMMTGTLNMADLATRLHDLSGNRTVAVGVGFLFAGLAIKSAVFPLHKWLPAAYSEAPLPVTVFLASTATKVSLYVMIRFFFGLLADMPLLAGHPWAEALLPLALVGLLSGSLTALFQGSVARMLAYSSVAQIGAITLGLALASPAGIAAALLHIYNHALMKGLLFMAVGAVSLRLGSVRLADWRGLGRRMPVTAACLLIGGLALVGMPLTAGFLSKWALVEAAFLRGWSLLALVIVLSSLLTLAYVWRLVETLYLLPAPPEAARLAEAPWLMRLPMLFLAGSVLWFGVDPRLQTLAQDAAHSLSQSALVAPSSGSPTGPAATGAPR